jgi:predicted RNA binding protein YcfA (HicA-like mRNA interferase family)
MTRRQKLFEELKNNPANIRFRQVDALLRYEGFVLFNQRGSHCTYHHGDGRILTVVKPHGGRKACHASDVRRLLEILSHEIDA